jgi:polysaccharide pyruvyl transferase WcaK-like protein
MRIAFISPCGYGNLGDAAIQDAFLDNARSVLGPGVEFVGITHNPTDTRRRHGVRAVPMDVDGFVMRRTRRPIEPAFTIGPEVPRRRPAATTRAARSLKRGVKETVHWTKALREMRRADVLVVSGGGQLDEHWGGPWGVPYALWKWTLAARVCRSRVAFLSVGAGTTESALTRFFLRSALRRAYYASFRDDRTAARVHTLELSPSTRVVPDLAFSHREGRAEQRAEARGGRRTVVVSPMAFLDPISWPTKDEAAYETYLAKIVDLVTGLLDSDLAVVVCTSDTPDMRAAARIVEALPQLESLRKGTYVLRTTDTTEELFAAFREADVVVASRLHGLILANLVGKPTIALSYDWKVDEHMRSVGLEGFAFGIESFEPREVALAIQEALLSRASLTDALRERCGALAGQVLTQYRVAFEPWQLEGGSAASP